MFGHVTVREVLYCHHDEISEEGPFGSGTATNYLEMSTPLNCEVLVKRHT